MGRTLPTQINLLQQSEEEWKGFRRALRKEDQTAFDELWTYARRHAVAASEAQRPLPFDAHLLGMLVGMKRELDELRCKVAGS
jgi:hypothetical protein